MKVLAIGNSFSQDATRYLHDIAKADGVALEVANLYIGGCSLERHYRNMLSGDAKYELQYDGHATGFCVSLDDALLNRQWDVITLQQASHESFKPDSYTPYIQELAEHIRLCQPKAKLLVHQTWAYEANSEKLLNITPFATPAQMFAQIEAAYAQAAALIEADGIIPSGELMMLLLQKGVETVHRDGFHLTRGLGRYAAGLLWYRLLGGNAVAENAFLSFDEPISAQEIALAKVCVDTFAPIFKSI